MFLCVRKQAIVLEPGVRAIPAVEAVEAVEADPDNGIEAVEAVEAVEGVPGKEPVMGEEVAKAQIVGERQLARSVGEGLLYDIYELTFGADNAPRLSEKLSASQETVTQSVESTVFRNAAGDKVA